MRDWDWTDWLPWVVTVIVSTALIVWAVAYENSHQRDRHCGSYICQPMLVGKVVVPFCHEVAR